MDLPTAIGKWQTLLGPAQVLLGTQVSDIYGTDTGAAERQVPAALRIMNSNCVSEVMRIAAHCKVPVYPISTGRNWGYGSALPAQDGCVILDLSPLTRIIDFDAELGVVTLEPGVTQGMLADFLSAGNHPYLVPVTGAGPHCSLMGNALERGYGVTPHMDHFGAVTDLEAILADGSQYRSALKEAGGEDLARLFKWGIGPYSTGLFTQSGFGVVTRMSIVLSRRSECVKACFFGLQDDRLLEAAVERIRRVLVQLPGLIGGVNLMNQHRVMSMAAPYPVDQLGPDGLIPPDVLAQLGRKSHVMPWTGFITLYGTRRTVRAAQHEIRRTLSGVASRVVFFSPEQARSLARFLQWIPSGFGERFRRTVNTLSQSLELVAGRPNETALPLAYWRSGKKQLGAHKDPARDGCGLIWYAPLVPMRPADVRNYVDMVKQITLHHGLEPLVTLTSVNDRLFDSTVPLLFDRDDPSAVARAQTCHKALLQAGREKGWFPYRVGIDTMQTLADLQVDSKAFHSRLRLGLDPNNLMSPGRYR